MSQGIALRPSQFVLTYGVGSILESPNGPRAVLDFKDWGGPFNSRNLSLVLSKDYEIQEMNLSALLDGGKIFRLPTNADLLQTNDTPVFRTGLFPRWAHCLTHDIIYELRPDGRTRCPNCSPAEYAQDQAVRFVRACRRGHLDDVDWPKVVHQKADPCDEELFRWIEGGSTLAEIRIRCLKCGAEIGMSQVYYGKHFCSGRLLESGEKEHCNEEASVILRNASNLRVAVLESALTIPPRDTRPRRILENSYLYSALALAVKQSWTKEEIIEHLGGFGDSIPGFNAVSLDEIRKTPARVLLRTINDIVSTKQLRRKLSAQEIRDMELEALKNAALLGHPPQPDSSVHDFEVDRESVKTFSLSKNLKLRVTPINRLRVVIAQKGYRRIVGKGPHVPRETFLKLRQERWYLGVALGGEGIFIDLSPNEASLDDTLSGDDWTSEFESKKDLSYHPVFVWWHTLSHRIIKALGLDSGYSSAAIRERIYVRYDHSTKKAEGALLLYTSQKGGDGTLGGLIALVPQFDRVFTSALRNINSCSNDPLCLERRVNSTRTNGAACFACLFTSETSCEFGNSYLDRNLLRLNL